MTGAGESPVAIPRRHWGALVVSPETRDRLRDDPSFNGDRIVSW